MKIKASNLDLISRDKTIHTVSKTECAYLAGGAIGEKYRRRRGDWEEPSYSLSAPVTSTLKKVNQGFVDTMRGIADTVDGIIYKTGHGDTIDKVADELDRAIDHSPIPVFQFWKPIRHLMEEWNLSTP